MTLSMRAVRTLVLLLGGVLAVLAARCMLNAILTRRI